MPPASSPETDPVAWIGKADEDLELARRVLASYAGSADDRLLQGICFHGQQAVEKALKGFLTHRQAVTPQTAGA